MMEVEKGGELEDIGLKILQMIQIKISYNKMPKVFCQFGKSQFKEVISYNKQIL